MKSDWRKLTDDGMKKLAVPIDTDLLCSDGLLTPVGNKKYKVKQADLNKLPEHVRVQMNVREYSGEFLIVTFVKAPT